VDFNELGEAGGKIVSDIGHGIRQICGIPFVATRAAHRGFRPAGDETVGRLVVGSCRAVGSAVGSHLGAFEPVL